MKGDLLKHGNNNIVLLDATFGTNHMKMPLYTGLGIDEFGNGVPAFMVLCQSVSQENIAKWLAALLQHVRHDNPDWMCSCIMVDDAIAEINAIRCTTTVCSVELEITTAYIATNNCTHWCHPVHALIDAFCLSTILSFRIQIGHGCHCMLLPLLYGPALIAAILPY